MLLCDFLVQQVFQRRAAHEAGALIDDVALFVNQKVIGNELDVETLGQ